MPKIKREKLYPLAERQFLKQKAKLTGEKRCPKKGEWYLSGAIPAAYQAPNDLSTEYCLCELVEDGCNAAGVKQGMVQEIEALRDCHFGSPMVLRLPKWQSEEHRIM